ncbi:MAG: MarR family transcriptional regulator [Croceibacterium sp.]
MTRLMVLAARRWRAQLDEKLRPLGQSAARMEALSAIINSPDPSSQIDIAKRLKIEGPTMTRMIDSLTADGLVERRPAPGDRRTKHLVLTAKGDSTLATIFAVMDPLRKRLLAGIPAAELAHLTAFFETVLDRLESANGQRAGD